MTEKRARNELINQELQLLYEQNTKAILNEWEIAFSIEKDAPAPQRINLFGIIDPENYDPDNGILFIGKETNGWDNNDFESGNLFLCWVRRLLNGENVCAHPTIWYNIGRWAKYLKNPQIDKEILLCEKREALKGLSYIAFTNVNKVRGGSSSKKAFSALSKMDTTRSLLQKEIDEKFKPKYIVLCGIDKDILVNAPISAKIVKMPHPSARMSKRVMLEKLEQQLHQHNK